MLVTMTCNDDIYSINAHIIYMVIIATITAFSTFQILISEVEFGVCLSAGGWGEDQWWLIMY